MYAINAGKNSSNQRSGRRKMSSKFRWAVKCPQCTNTHHIWIDQPDQNSIFTPYESGPEYAPCVPCQNAEKLDRILAAIEPRHDFVESRYYECPCGWGDFRHDKNTMLPKWLGCEKCKGMAMPQFPRPITASSVEQEGTDN